MTVDLAIGLVLVFATIALVTGTMVSAVIRRHAPERKRLRELAVPAEKRVWRETQLLTDTPNALAERICRLLPRSAERMDQMRQRLIAGGYRSQTSPVVLAASQIVGAAACGMLLLTATGNLAIALLAMIPGFLLPDLWLTYQIRE